MDYMELECHIEPVDPGREILIAHLADAGFESFIETDRGVTAYIPEVHFSEEGLAAIKSLLKDFNLTWSHRVIPRQNWNALWEKNYEPVVIAGKLAVRAPFHEPLAENELEIVIEPKMSFGTGHHPTTVLMAELMLQNRFTGLHVLDIGTGTGILAILAEKLGAGAVKALDNDPWACENARENAGKNNCKNLIVVHGDRKTLEKDTAGYDVILANINKNTILDLLPVMAERMRQGSGCILSGFYTGEKNEITRYALGHHLKEGPSLSLDQWVACQFNLQ